MFRLFSTMFLFAPDGADGGSDPDDSGNENDKGNKNDAPDPLAKLSNEELVGLVKTLRHESSGRRRDGNDLKKENDKLKADAQKRSDDEKAKNGEFEKLADERLAALTILKAESVEKDGQLAEFETFKTAQRKSYKDSIGDKWTPEMDEMPLNVVKIVADTLGGKKKTFDTDGGGNIGGLETEQKRFDELLAKGDARDRLETKELRELSVKLKNAKKKKE